MTASFEDGMHGARPLNGVLQKVVVNAVELANFAGGGGGEGNAALPAAGAGSGIAALPASGAWLSVVDARRSQMMRWRSTAESKAVMSQVTSASIALAMAASKASSEYGSAGGAASRAGRAARRRGDSCSAPEEVLEHGSGDGVRVDRVGAGFHLGAQGVNAILTNGNIAGELAGGRADGGSVLRGVECGSGE